MKTPKSKYLKNLLTTIGLYLLLYLTYLVLDYSEPGGPCAPGMGILFLVLGIPFFVFIMIMVISFHIKEKKHLLPGLIIHILIAVSIVLLVMASFLK